MQQTLNSNAESSEGIIQNLKHLVIRWERIQTLDRQIDTSKVGLKCAPCMQFDLKHFRPSRWIINTFLL